MSDLANNLQTALQHAGAWLLLELGKMQRGYTTLQPNEPAVAASVQVAQTEAEARGVSGEEIAAIQPQHVIETAQKMGAAGADAHVVLADTKANVTPVEEAQPVEEPVALPHEEANEPVEAEHAEKAS
jgi:hypothetical protein